MPNISGKPTVFWGYRKRHGQNYTVYAHFRHRSQPQHPNAVETFPDRNRQGYCIDLIYVLQPKLPEDQG